MYFIASLAITARLRENESLASQRDDLLSIIGKYKARIVEWQSQSDANYAMWSLLIDAEVHELQHRYHDAIQAYEAAIDHAQLHDFNLEMALILESQAGFFVRRGGKRAAVATFRDSMAVYSRIGATGKVEQMATKHEFILSTFGFMGYQDVAVQTEQNLFEFNSNQLLLSKNDQQETRNIDGDAAIDRTKAWVSPTQDSPVTVQESLQTDLGLDILDLTSILKFSQAISSELDIDKLLVKMMEIITSSVGSQSDVVHIVTENEGDWCIASTSSSEGISSTVCSEVP